MSNDHGDDKKVAAPVPTLPLVTDTSRADNGTSRSFTVLREVPSGGNLLKMGQCEDDTKIPFPVVHSALF